MKERGKWGPGRRRGGPPAARRRVSPSPQGGLDGAATATAPTTPPDWVASGGATGGFEPDAAGRPTLLFDLNGVLLVNPRAPRGGKRTPVMRPGIEEIGRLASVFRLGAYSSATAATVKKALAAVDAAVRAGVPDPESLPDPLFELVLCRAHCRPAGAERVAAGGNEWDTVKPLGLHFGGSPSLPRLALVDNDAHKAVPGEEDNMVLVPTWDGPGRPGRGGARVLAALVDALLCPRRGLARAADVRGRTALVSAAVERAAAEGAVEVVEVEVGGEEAAAAAASAPPAPQEESAPQSALAAPTTSTSEPSLFTPAARSAWKTAIVQAVVELCDVAGVDANLVYAYARFRAAGLAKAHLTKARLKEALASAASKRGALRAVPRGGADLVAASPKLIARCFKLAPGATAPDTATALASLADALGGGRGGEGDQGGEGRPRGGSLAGATAGVAIACVRDLTVSGQGWNAEAVRRTPAPAQSIARRVRRNRAGREIDTHAHSSTGQPRPFHGPRPAPRRRTLWQARGRARRAGHGREERAAARARRGGLRRWRCRTMRALFSAHFRARMHTTTFHPPQELRIETHAFGEGTPVALIGLRCMARPTPNDVKAALDMLAVMKKDAEKVSPRWRGRGEGGGERAEQAANPPFSNSPHPFQPRAVIAGTLAHNPALPHPATTASTGHATSPLAADESFGNIVPLHAPLPVFVDRALLGARQPAPHKRICAAQAFAEQPILAQEAAPAPAPTPSANWWDPAPHGAPVPPARAAHVSGAHLSALHHEVLEFARAASPSQVRRIWGWPPRCRAGPARRRARFPPPTHPPPTLLRPLSLPCALPWTP